MRTTIPIDFPFVFKHSCARLLALAALLAASLCGAQTPAAHPKPSAPKTAHAHRSAHPRKHPAKAKAAAAQAAPAPVAAAPPQPEAPKWPVNEKPAQASVVWDSHGLRIDAQNSSLQQILEDVATATGAKVEGLGSDERIFGVYGPGQARDVLSQLLQGSGYNFLMVGGQGQGAPRQIVLSARRTGETPAVTNAAQTAAAQDDDADSDEPPAIQPAPPGRPGFNPGGQPRTPQQMMQEMRQRQQQMQQPATPPQ